ncbi:type VI secretion system baseplate subunit TssK [Herbaspirillum sp. RTI4]|uniref:type VI secretion system baseplate subunit TssK n=1 Tax=Herbaspirillum sp. RTI4 TaxID=3048640 RepID=UPI002AB5038F|nr:type VI secretion system baseplate subunit TssK [Herbaspirillum sp. RTI4]MDY7579034.1 type VI secretion system baseplate subunit TssK [Herbaspirillum sp. RTI4]MEA9982381.1 type VI secretion system baseplate subunit TssK [Herbaspirillum sp. RTI4]
MNTSKILWGEGLFLRPQHFQQQDQYHEKRLHEMSVALHPYVWGVLSMEIDEEALKNSSLRFLRLSVIFQDGEIYMAPEQDALPAAIDLSNLPHDHPTITYHIALPYLKDTGDNASQTAEYSHAHRYTQSNTGTCDLFTKAAEAELSFLKKSVRLVSGLDPRASLTHFPITRLQRCAGNGYEVDPTFIAPSLSIKSAPGIRRRLHQLMDALHAKVSALYGHHREPSKNVIEFRSGDTSSFWFLHTASSAYASLAHYYHHQDFHPERLFQQLLSLAGALMTFSKTHTLTDLPMYQHDDPGPCYSKLDQIIRDLLDTVISSRYFSIALSQTKPCYLHGVLDSGKINEKTAFYLAIGADIPALELVETVPTIVKLGSPEDVDKFVLSSMPGVKISHMPQVPSVLPVRPETYYFSLESKGPIYDRMLQAQSISIYVPSNFKDPRIELFAVTS